MAAERQVKSAIADFWRTMYDSPPEYHAAAGGFLAGLELAASHPEYAIALHRSVEREWGQDHASDDPYIMVGFADDLIKMMGPMSHVS